MIPKAELHVHLEGAAPPDLIRRLAARNRIALPENLFDGNGLFAWTDFLNFLEVYDTVTTAIRTPEDYRDVTFEYLAKCASEGAIYVEVMSSPDHATQTGMSYQNHLDGIVAGIEDAQAEFGIEGRIIVTCVRHFGTERAMEVARNVVRHPHPLVTGFGMGGDEAGFPPEPFANVFRYVADSGLGCTVHAGEWAGPESVREAVDTLPVTRIGHGVRAVEDPTLPSDLAARGIALEVCPGSNIATGLYPSHADHPLPDLREAGLAVSLNSDDPPYFGASVGGEYDAAAAHFGLADEELRQITLDALDAAFVDDETRAALKDRVRSG
jgi:adenosine deaminase